MPGRWCSRSCSHHSRSPRPPRWARESRGSLRGGRGSGVRGASVAREPLHGLGSYRGTFRRARAARPRRNAAHARLRPGWAVAIAVALVPRVVAAAERRRRARRRCSVWQFEGVGRLPPGFHETVWSVSLIEWLFVAGVLGAHVACRSGSLPWAAG